MESTPAPEATEYSAERTRLSISAPLKPSVSPGRPRDIEGAGIELTAAQMNIENDPALFIRREIDKKDFVETPFARRTA